MTPKEKNQVYVKGLARGLTKREALRAAGIEPGSYAEVLAEEYEKSQEGKGLLLKETRKSDGHGCPSKLAKLSMEEAINESQRYRGMAERAGDFKTAFTFLQFEAKLSGLLVERVENTLKVDIADNIREGRFRARITDDVVDVEAK